MLGFSRQATQVSWQDRIRDPSLTALLVLQLCLIFLAAPLAAKGVASAKPVVGTVVLATMVIVVMLSPRREAAATIVVGLAAILAGLSLDGRSSPIVSSVLHWGGDILMSLAVIWVLAHAVYAPGRITLHRLRGAAALYLSVAIMFTSAFSLVWEFNPAAFAGVATARDEVGTFAAMLYFSLTSLTTTGYGDIVPVDPFARSLANLESAIGVFYITITVARLVTLELEDRRLAAATAAHARRR